LFHVNKTEQHDKNRVISLFMVRDDGVEES
jgi:hypothetical protein